MPSVYTNTVAGKALAFTWNYDIYYTRLTQPAEQQAYN